MKTYWWMLLVVVGWSYSIAELSWGMDCITIGSKSSFSMDVPDDMRFVPEHKDDAVGTVIREIPQKTLTYSHDIFFSYVDIHFGYRFFKTIDIGVFGGISYFDGNDNAPGIEDSRSLSHIMELNYNSSPTDSLANGNRSMGAALVYYKAAVKDVPAGLYLQYSAPVIDDFTLLTLRARVHYSRITAQNGWDRYGFLEAKENRTMVRCFPTELTLGVGINLDKGFVGCNFSLLLPYLGYTVVNKESNFKINNNFGFAATLLAQNIYATKED
jgi:hypothetical protein